MSVFFALAILLQVLTSAKIIAFLRKDMCMGMFTENSLESITLAKPQTSFNKKWRN